MPDTTPPILAALFDMDGVLVDNTDFHLNAWLQFAHKHDRPLTKEQYVEHINGRVSADAMGYVFQRPISPGELIVLTEEKESIYRDIYRPHLQPAPGLLDFLTALQSRGIKLAVGTSAPQSNVNFTLDELPLRHYFNAIVDASMVHRGKPDPEIYQKAAEHVGADPAHCVVFEDAFAGVEAGLRAGIKVVAVATTHTRAELADVGASLIIDDFTQLTADDIQHLIG